MALIYITVQPENRVPFLNALHQLELPAIEVVENTPEPGDLALQVDHLDDPHEAAGRVGQILDAANEMAGRQLGAIASGEIGWGDPPQKI